MSYHQSWKVLFLEYFHWKEVQSNTPIGAYNKLEMTENITEIYEKFERKKMSDLVRCCISLYVFPWNPILFGGWVWKYFHEKRRKDGEHLTKSLISFPTLYKTSLVSNNFSDFFIKQTLREGVQNHILWDYLYCLVEKGKKRKNSRPYTSKNIDKSNVPTDKRTR